ncbi:hypothetical protein LPJ72_006464, partial [Coemansia sp. Benny D160-2]
VCPRLSQDKPRRGDQIFPARRISQTEWRAFKLIQVNRAQALPVPSAPLTISSTQMATLLLPRRRLQPRGRIRTREAAETRMHAD